MANKKPVQNNQNKKNTDGPTMNGNTVPVQTVQNLVGHGANQANNNGPLQQSNATSSSSSATPATNSTSSSSSHHHQQPNQRLSSSSSQGGGNNRNQQLPLKKTQHSDVDKFQVSNSGSQASQNSFRGGGGNNKDPRARDKENVFCSFRSYRTGGQGHHHQNGQQNNQINQNGNGGGGQRKKDKNRDHSSQSHRSGGGYSGYNNSSSSSHHHSNNQFQLGDKVKAIGFPPMVQTPPSLQNSPSPAAATSSQSAPNVMTSPVALQSRTVQTEPVEEKIKVKKVTVVKKEPEEVRKEKDALQDTVMAFMEHDEWNKVELMCELLSFLSPVDLRLVGNCIEGSVRCYTNQMRPVEKTSNCAEPTASLPPFVCVQPAPPVSDNQNAVAAQRYGILQTCRRNGPMQGPPGLPPLVVGDSSPKPSQVPNGDGTSFHPSSATPSSSSVSTTNVNESVYNMANGTSSANRADEPISRDAPEVPESAPSSTSTSTPSTAPISVSTSTVPPPPSHTSPNVPATAETPEDSEPPVPQDPERFLQSVRELTSYVYILMAVCASTNRKSAAKIVDYVSRVLLPEKAGILAKIPGTLDKIEVLQAIGKIVAAIVHHPAVSVDNKIKYGDLRGSLRAEIDHHYRVYTTSEEEKDKLKKKRELEHSGEEQGVGREEQEGEESEEELDDEYEQLDGVYAKMGPMTRAVYDLGLEAQREAAELEANERAKRAASLPMVFIERFIGRQTQKNDEFSLEIQWNDGDRTFTMRTADQLRALQHRLLDKFGQQRSEKYQNLIANTSPATAVQLEERMLASTSTLDASSPSGDRILPRLDRQATPAQIVQYINQLSELPATIMLSAIIWEEFGGTRAKTEDLLQVTAREPADGLIFSRWKNPRDKSPVRFYSNRNLNGDVIPIQLPTNLPPFLYSGLNPGHMQTLYPSCSNCAGQHQYKDCDKITLMDKKVEHKLRLEPDASQLGPSSSSSMGPHYPSASATSSSTGPLIYMDGGGHVIMNHPGHVSQHFNFHQNQHQQQHQHQLQHLINNGAGLYSIRGPFRPTGPYDPATMMMYAQVPPPPPPQLPQTQQQAASSSNSQQNGPGAPAPSF